MDCETKIKELRATTGMNRREFCDFFEIPYQTVTDWERGARHAPDYLIRLLEYYILTENVRSSRGRKKIKTKKEEA